MAAHKKGQAFHGHYTESNTLTTPSAMHDDEGYLKPRSNDMAGGIEDASAAEPKYVRPVGGSAGLNGVLPKKVR